MKKAIKVGLSLVTAVTAGYVGYKTVKFFKEVADELHTGTGANTDADTDVDTVDEGEEEADSDYCYDTGVEIVYQIAKSQNVIVMIAVLVIIKKTVEKAVLEV